MKEAIMLVLLCSTDVQQGECTPEKNIKVLAREDFRKARDCSLIAAEITSDQALDDIAHAIRDRSFIKIVCDDVVTIQGGGRHGTNGLY